LSSEALGGLTGIACPVKAICPAVSYCHTRKCPAFACIGLIVTFSTAAFALRGTLQPFSSPPWSLNDVGTVIFFDTSLPWSPRTIHADTLEIVWIQISKLSGWQVSIVTTLVSTIRHGVTGVNVSQLVLASVPNNNTNTNQRYYYKFKINVVKHKP